MGEFDKCHICTGFFIDLDSILGLICIILRFMPYFSNYAWFWLVRVLIAELCVSSQMLRESREIEAKPSQEMLQKRPNSPKTEDPRQNRQAKIKHKMERSRSDKAALARGHHRPWWLPQPARGGPLPPWDASVSRGCLFSCAAFRFVLLFCV